MQLAELQIAVLYQLHELGADTGHPSKWLRTPEGRLRVSGTVNDDALKQAIDTQLQNLEGHERLDLSIVSFREIMIPSASKRSTAVEAYEVTQPGFAADMRIRGYFQTKGLSGGRLDVAVALFSRDALQHAQRLCNTPTRWIDWGALFLPMSFAAYVRKRSRNGWGW